MGIQKEPFDVNSLIFCRWTSSGPEGAEIQPRFRKRGLGLLAVSRTIDLFGVNCGLVAMKPFPLQFRNYLNPGWRPPDGLQDPAVAFRIARRKLRQYWSRVGFKRVNGTDYYALCPINDRPSLKKVAAAIDETFAAQDQRVRDLVKVSPANHVPSKRGWDPFKFYASRVTLGCA